LTVTKTVDTEWAGLIQEIERILKSHYSPVK